MTGCVYRENLLIWARKCPQRMCSHLRTDSILNLRTAGFHTDAYIGIYINTRGAGLWTVSCKWSWRLISTDHSRSPNTISFRIYSFLRRILLFVVPSLLLNFPVGCSFTNRNVKSRKWKTTPTSNKPAEGVGKRRFWMWKWIRGTPLVLRSNLEHTVTILRFLLPSVDPYSMLTKCYIQPIEMLTNDNYNNIYHKSPPSCRPNGYWTTAFINISCAPSVTLTLRCARKRFPAPGKEIYTTLIHTTLFVVSWCFLCFQIIHK